MSAGAGYEYYTGPDNQLTRTVSGEVEATLHRTSLSLSVGRIDDAGAGAGLYLNGEAGLPIAQRTQLKLGAERSAGDSSYAVWKLEAGPSFELPRGRQLTLSYVRLEDSESAVTNGASAEIESPVIPDRLSASGTLAYSEHDTVSGFEGTAGLSWTPVDHVELEGDAGYTQTGISLNRPFSPKHIGKESAGKGRGKTVATTPSTDLGDSPGVTALLAVRFSFP